MSVQTTAVFVVFVTVAVNCCVVPNNMRPVAGCTVTEIGMVQPANVRSANVFDPNGIRIELNEWLPDSLTKKAAESWK